MSRLILLASLLAAPSAFAQTLTTVWDTTFAGVSAIGVSQDGATVAIGRSSVPFQRSTSITFHDAATGARTGALPKDGGAGFRTPSVLAFDATGASIYTAGRTDTCMNTCSSYADIVRIDTSSGAERFATRIDTRLATVSTSGDLLTYTRRLSNSGGVDFAVFEDGPDGLSLVFNGASASGNPVSLNNTFSPDGTRLVALRAYRGDYFADIRQVGTWEVLQTIALPSDLKQPASAALSPDNAFLAVTISPIAGSDPGTLHRFRVSDGAEIYSRQYEADSDNEIRFGALLTFAPDGEHIMGAESGFVGTFRTEWVSVFRASDGVRVASQRIGDPHVFNDRGPLGIRLVPGGAPGRSRYAVLAYDYAGVVEMGTNEQPVAAQGEAPDAGLTLAVAPNPAVRAATLRLASAAPQTVRAELFDALGRRVAVLFDGELSAERAVSIPSVPPGVYVVRATTAAGVATQRLVVSGR